MMKKQGPSIQDIIDYLKAYYGINVDSLKLLSIGADLNASVYQAHTDSSCYFIKLKYGHLEDTSPILLELLFQSGIQQIIPPIKTIQGNHIHHTVNFSVIVYPFIEGQDGFSCHLTDDEWFTLGKAIRKVHEFNLPLSLQANIRKESYTDKWREIVRSYYMKHRIESSQDPIALKFMAFMEEHRSIIQQLVKNAETLSQKIQKQPTNFVLCHSDIHGGNVLIDRTGGFYIVDWDEPIMAPKERDLMFIGGGVANVWNKPHEEKLFYEGYGKTDINMTILAYYRFERIVEDIAQYSQELLSSKFVTKDKPIMLQQFLNMFTTNGVVDIAFKTLK